MRNLSWPLHGSGIEKLGKGGKPVQYDLRELGDDELLVRHDAVSLCYTDVKEVRFGETHPRLIGRNLEEHPIVPGHEVCFTVMEVGAGLENRFHPGEHYALQPDVWYQGKSVPFSFGMDGAYRQFGIIGKEILESDEGCLLLPIPDDMPYAAAAISEPWACVEASYHLDYRTALKKDGELLVICSAEAAGREYAWRGFMEGQERPAAITAVGICENLAAGLARFSEENGIRFRQETLAELAGDEKRFDDVILLQATNELVRLATGKLAKKAIVALVGIAEDHADLDVGALHYNDIQYTGTGSDDWADAYAYSVRSELKAGGITMTQGSGGPMGLMHIQRALELPNGPSVVIATDHHDDRLEHIRSFLGPVAQAQGRTLITVNEHHADEYRAVMEQIMGQGGFDDIVTMIANPQAIADTFAFLAPGGVMNIFSGMKGGTLGTFDMGMMLGPQRRTVLGHSGSKLADQQTIIDKFSRHELDTWKSVAAIGGMAQVPDGIAAMMEARYSGKIIIYPHVEDFPLSAVSDLEGLLPEVAEMLSEGGTWNQEAERRFLEIMGAVM